MQTIKYVFFLISDLFEYLPISKPHLSRNGGPQVINVNELRSKIAILDRVFRRMEDHIVEIHYWLTHSPSANGGDPGRWAGRMLVLYYDLCADELEWSHAVYDLRIVLGIVPYLEV